jgi:small-conductance mechanosensitive channel
MEVVRTCTAFSPMFPMSFQKDGRTPYMLTQYAPVLCFLSTSRRSAMNWPTWCKIERVMGVRMMMRMMMMMMMMMMTTMMMIMLTTTTTTTMMMMMMMMMMMHPVSPSRRHRGPGHRPST